MGRTGEAVRRVTRDGFEAQLVAGWSRFVYATGNVDLNPLNTDGYSELRVVRLSSGEQKRVEAGDAALPSWSPRGNRIAYTKRLGENRRRDIWTISATTGESTAVTDDAANDWSPTWSPDGFLYFSGDLGGSMNLWRVAIDEVTGKPRGELEPITTPAPFLAHAASPVTGRGSSTARSIRSATFSGSSWIRTVVLPKGEPSWLTTGSRSWSTDRSPDRAMGCLLLWCAVRKTPRCTAQRNGPSRVDDRCGVDHRVPRWSPDGSWIAFFSNRTGMYQLWRIRPDGSDLQQLTDAGDDVRYPIWSPDGSEDGRNGDRKNSGGGASLYLRAWQTLEHRDLAALARIFRLPAACSSSTPGRPTDNALTVRPGLCLRASSPANCILGHIQATDGLW